MHILFVVPYVPSEIRTRSLNLIKVMLQRQNQVALATLWSNEAERDQLQVLEALGVTVYARPLSRLQRIKNCVRTLPTSTPLQATYCWQPELAALLETLLEANYFDVIHVEHLRGVRYALALKDRGIPIVWDSVDCISYLFEQASSYSRSLFGKWITLFELGRTRKYEAWLLSQFQSILVTSPIDKKALLDLANNYENRAAQLHPETIEVLYNGVDNSHFKPAVEKKMDQVDNQSEDATLIFSGKMSYHANEAMALYLVQEIMPLVWEKYAQVKLQIVGKDPSRAIQKLGVDHRVVVTGYVPDIQPYLQQATAALVPLLYGAGLQFKVIEAMACATPVVATERVMWPLAAKAGVHLLVAQDATTFANQIIRLLDNAELRHQVGWAGYTYAKSYHDWVKLGAALEDTYHKVITNDQNVQEPIRIRS